MIDGGLVVEGKLGCDSSIGGSGFTDASSSFGSLRTPRGALDMGSVPATRFDDPLNLELSEGASHRSRCDTEVGGELTDRGKSASDGEHAGGHQLTDGASKLLERRNRRVGVDSDDHCSIGRRTRQAAPRNVQAETAPPRAHRAAMAPMACNQPGAA